MTTDQTKKTLRQFQCRDYLWEVFEQMSNELGTSVDYLVNESMRQYARSRNYGAAAAQGVSMMPQASLGETTNPNTLGQSMAMTGRLDPTAPLVRGPGLSPPSLGAPSIVAPSSLASSSLASSSLAPSSLAATPSLGGLAPPSSTGGFPKATEIHYGSPKAPPPMGTPSLPPGPTMRPPSSSGGLPAPPPFGSTGGFPAASPFGAPPPLAPPPMAPPPLANSGSNAPRLSDRPPLPQSNNAGALQSLFVVFNGQRFPVNKEEFIIGRGSKTADLAIKDGNISRRHAAVVWQGNGWYMRDLGSTNGVEFQGRKVDNRHIQEGDSYTLCDYEIRFTYR